MSQPQLSTAITPRLSTRELRAALDTLHAIGEACSGSADFARRGVERLPRLLGSDLTTLVVCDLDKGHRTVVPSGRSGIRSRPKFTSATTCSSAAKKAS